MEKKTDIVLGTSTSLGCLGFSTFGMRDPCSIGIYRNINFGQKKKRTFSKDYFESSPAKELPPCLQQQPRQQAVPNCLRSDIQMTTSGPMVLSKPAGANFPGAPSVPKVTLCFPKRKVSSTSPFFSFENFGTGSLSEGFNRAKTPGPSLDCLAMREASPQLMKTFEIQLDPTKDVPTLFVVHNIKEPGWYESLVKDCDKWLKRHRRNLGDVGANHIKIAKLVSYPKYIKLSNIPLLELCDNTFLVIPQFENIVSTLSEEEWSLDKQGNIGPRGSRGGRKKGRGQKKSKGKKGKNKKGKGKKSKKQSKKSNKNKKEKRENVGSKEGGEEGEKKGRFNKYKQKGKTMAEKKKASIKEQKRKAKKGMGMVKEKIQHKRQQRKQKSSEKKSKKYEDKMNKHRETSENLKELNMQYHADKAEKHQQKTVGSNMCANTRSYFYKTFICPWGTKKKVGVGIAASDRVCATCTSDNCGDHDTLICRKITKVPKTTTFTITNTQEVPNDCDDKKNNPCQVAQDLCNLSATTGKSYSVDCSSSEILLNPRTTAPVRSVALVCADICNDRRKCKPTKGPRSGPPGRLSNQCLREFVVAPPAYHPQRFEYLKRFYDSFLEEATGKLPDVLASANGVEEINAFLNISEDPDWMNRETVLKALSGTNPSNMDTKVTTEIENGDDYDDKDGSEKENVSKPLNGKWWWMSHSVHTFVFNVVVEDMDYEDMGGNFSAFLSMFFPKNNMKVLMAMLGVIVPGLSALLRKLVLSPEVSSAILARKTSLRSCKLELEETKQYLELEKNTLIQIYSNGITPLRRSKGLPETLPIDVLMRLSDRDLREDLSSGLIPKFEATRAEIRHSQDLLAQQVERCSEELATEAPGYRALLKNGLSFIYDLQEFQKWVMDLRDNQELSSFTALVGVPAITNLCKSKMIGWHNNYLEEEVRGQRRQFETLVGVTPLEQSEPIFGSNSRTMQKDTFIGSNMSTVGYRKKTQVVRGSNCPDVFDSSGFVLTKPGTCEHLLMQAQQPLDDDEYPTNEEVLDAIRDMEEENYRIDGEVEDGNMIEKYDTDYEHLYHNGQYTTKEMEPFSEPCYVQDKAVINYDDLGMDECDLELLQLMQSARRTFGDCKKKDCPPTKPVVTTTTITTTSL